MEQYSREFKVGIVVIISLFFLYFGFNFLKGKNIFLRTASYVGLYADMNGLEEQAPVYLKGFKIGQVDQIIYDYTKSEAFTVIITIKKDIVLNYGTTMHLVPDGLLGGTAVELRPPTSKDLATNINKEPYKDFDTLNTFTTISLTDDLQKNILPSLQKVLVDIVVVSDRLKTQLDNNYVEGILGNVNQITTDLKSTSSELKKIMKQDIPRIVKNTDTTMKKLNEVSAKLNKIDFEKTMSKADTALNSVNTALYSFNSRESSLGLLLNDTLLYHNLNKTIQSIDTLVVDLKEHPKRYVHFSLFGRKKDK